MEFVVGVSGLKKEHQFSCASPLFWELLVELWQNLAYLHCFFSKKIEIDVPSKN